MVGEGQGQREIDENLCRSELTNAQVAEFAIEREAIVARMEAGARESTVPNGTPLSKNAKRGAGIKTGPDTGSLREVAELTGKGKTTVARAVQEVKALGGAAMRKRGEAQ